MNDNKQFWQKFAKLYSPFMEHGNRYTYEQICTLVSPYLSDGMQVLELACGSGQLSFRLADRVKLWTATDFSENMITEAERYPGKKNLHFSVQDATNLPYADESFDAVMIANALHIMPEPYRAMEEIHRVLKSGGMLFAPTFVHGEGAGYNLRMRFMNLIGFRTFSKWNADEFERFVAEHGFQKVEKKVIGSNLTPLCCLIAQKLESSERK